ncbi:hypothetical protein PENSPDRAFT_650526 [Peniophora sp. CONT]|nr:hypothetical protein PENSPDRAFT_650526 [Peniophora sp. CONT]
MHGVVRFEDLTELGLPTSSPPAYPKVIRSGIDEEGQHRKSPPIVAKDGIMMLLHRLGYPELIKRLLDVDGTRDFELSLDFKDSTLMNSYVRRHGRLVEMGLRTEADPFPQTGIRYTIQDVDPALPYTIGPWKPESATTLSGTWGGNGSWIQAQGESIAKAFWYQKYWNAALNSVSWSNIDDSTRADIKRWDAERMAKVEAQRQKDNEEYEKQKAEYEASQTELPFDLVAVPRNYGKRLRRCRADCGAEECTLECTKCKLTRYCSRECQLEDWKYHKSICGTEEGNEGDGFMRMAYNSRWDYQSKQS